MTFLYKKKKIACEQAEKKNVAGGNMCVFAWVCADNYRHGEMEVKGRGWVVNRPGRFRIRHVFVVILT